MRYAGVQFQVELLAQNNKAKRNERVFKTVDASLLKYICNDLFIDINERSEFLIVGDGKNSTQKLVHKK